MNRIPALDGIRALAIILVVFNHVQVFLKPLSGPAAYFCREVGWSGVYLFFVLSGYLIGRLALSEIAATGHLKVASFWARRILRTWPLYFVALFVNYWLVPHRAPPAPSLWSYMTFTQIFFRMNYFIESWTLSVEEQFYFILPLVLVVAVRLGGRRWIGAVCLLFIAASYVVRFRTGYFLHPATTFDSLFLGVLIAHLQALGRPSFEFFYAHSRYSLLAGIVILGLAYAAGGRYGPRQFQGYLAIGFGLILVSALNPASVVSRLLSARIFKVIAVSSYSTYLSHVIFILGLRYLGWGPAVFSGLAGWGIFLLASTGALMFGWFVYQLLERPGLWLREVLVPRRRSASQSRAFSSQEAKAALAPNEPLAETSGSR